MKKSLVIPLSYPHSAHPHLDPNGVTMTHYVQISMYDSPLSKPHHATLLFRNKKLLFCVKILFDQLNLTVPKMQTLLCGRYGIIGWSFSQWQTVLFHLALHMCAAFNVATERILGHHNSLVNFLNQYFLRYLHGRPVC